MRCMVQCYLPTVHGLTTNVWAYYPSYLMITTGSYVKTFEPGCQTTQGRKSTLILHIKCHQTTYDAFWDWLHCEWCLSCSSSPSSIIVMISFWAVMSIRMLRISCEGVMVWRWWRYSVVMSMCDRMELVSIENVRL